MKAGLITIVLFAISLVNFAQEADSVVNLRLIGDSALLKDTAAFTVVAKFTVGANGKVGNIDILKNNCRSCSDKEKKEINEEVVNIIRKYPIAPRKDRNGKPRPTTYIQPIIFKLEEE